MLIKVDCEPRLVACVTLTFDDGTTKDVDIKRGMYATIQYMNLGVAQSVTGVVSNVFLAPKEMKPVRPDDIPNHLGYICDPNYVNSGFLDARDPHHRHPMPPRPPKPLHPGKCNNDFRNYIEVLDKQSGKSVRIDVYSITDIITLYQESKEVRTPDTSDRILFIRENNGVFEYSLNGNEWKEVTSNIDQSAFDQLKSVVTGNNTLLTEQVGKIAGYDATMTEYQAKILVQDQVIDGFKQQAAVQDQTIAALQSQVTELRNALEELKTKVQTPSE